MKSTCNFGYMLLLSIIAALGGFLFGYDEAVISGTISDVSQQFSLDEMAEGWFVGSALFGAIIGVAFAGALSDRFGRKRAMMLSALLFCISMIGCAFCSTFTGLVAYRSSFDRMPAVYLRNRRTKPQRAARVALPACHHCRHRGCLPCEQPIA